MAFMRLGTANATASHVDVSGGQVITAAPTYTTGQLNPLSLTVGGLLVSMELIQSIQQPQLRTRCSWLELLLLLLQATLLVN